jgi:hypothetical protein
VLAQPLAAIEPAGFPAGGQDVMNGAAGLALEQRLQIALLVGVLQLLESPGG